MAGVKIIGNGTQVATWPHDNPELLSQMLLVPQAPGRDLAATEQGKGRYVPLVWVDLIVGNDRFRVPACVDSGSGSTVIPGSVVQTIGIDYRTMPTAPDFMYSSGVAESRLLHASLAFGDWRLEGPLRIAEPGDGAIPWMLLGRVDFLAHFRVTFDWYRDPPTFSIEPGMPR